MPPSARASALLAVIGVAIVGGVFLSTRNGDEAAEVRIQNTQSLFTEASSTTAGVDTADTATSSVDISVPILVYHIVRPSYPSDSRAVRALAHTPQVFDAEMKYLGDAGYHITTFAALESYLEHGTPLPSNPVILSFDDGWSDQFTYAFPILEKYHYTAEFFVFTNPIGHRGFLTWDNLRTMLKAGMVIGDHTRSHPFLTKIADPAQLWNEIDGSKLLIEKTLGITVNEFAYPFGQHNATTTALVEKAGYKAARGDYLKRGGTASLATLYALGALNAPTTTTAFMLRFPRH